MIVIEESDYESGYFRPVSLMETDKSLDYWYKEFMERAENEEDSKVSYYPDQSVIYTKGTKIITVRNVSENQLIMRGY